MGHFLLLVVFVTVSVMAIHADHIDTNSINDGTMIANAFGRDVVDKALEIIKESCVFRARNDKLFMRRLAYVETYDGEKDGTFREEYHGGIWKVDEHMFDELKTPANKASLSKYTKQFLPELGIDWENTFWTDCRKARVSALAARLFLQLRDPDYSLIGDIMAQAEFWASTYRQNGANSKDFEDAANSLKQGCDKSIDLAFVLDSSFSVGSTNFEKMKTFAKEVVNEFEISTDKTHVSVLTFSGTVTTHFYLNRYTDKDSVLNHISTIKYPRGSSYTHLALAELYKEIFTQHRGARNSAVPKFAIFITDGLGEYPSKTAEEAKNVHDHGITVSAVGIAGARFNHLEVIASKPTCLYQLLFAYFDEIATLKETIMKGTCDAPINIGVNGSYGTAKMKNGTSQNCQMKVPKEGITVKINAKIGGVTLFISNKTYPSESYYDAHVQAVPGTPGVMHVNRPQEPEADGTVFCSVKADNEEDADFEYEALPEYKDYCESNECKNGATCVNNRLGGYTCSCPPEYEGRLCGERIKYDCITKSPCTEENEAAGRYFFPHYDVRKFVQCAFFRCYIHDCPPGTIFDPAFDVVACVNE